MSDGVQGKAPIFDPEKVERHNPIYQNEVGGPYVDAEDYDHLLALYRELLRKEKK